MMRIIAIAAATAFATGLVYHGPSQTWLIPLVGIPLLLLALWALPSRASRDHLAQLPVRSAAGLLHWLFLGWMAWLLVGIAWSAWPAVSWWYFLTLAWYPVAFVVLCAFPQAGLKLRDWLLAIGAVGVAYGLVEFLFTGERANSLFIDPNSFAALVNLLLFAAFGEVLSAGDNRRRGLLLGGLVALLAATLVLSQSRGAWIAFSGGAVLAALVLLRRGRVPRNALRTGMASLALGLLAGAALLGAQDLFGRAASVTGAGHARWLIWQATWELITTHGWLGTGLGSFTLLYPAVRSPAETGTTGFMAHNDYLQLALETGLPGIALLAAITVLIFWLFLRHCLGRAGNPGHGAAGRRVAGLFGLIGVLTVHAHALVNFVFYETALTVGAGAVLALAVIRLGLVSDRTTAPAQRPRFHPAAALACGLLSLALLVDAGAGLALNDRELGAKPLAGPRYQAALALSAFYPFNTLGPAYALTAQVHAAQTHRIPPIREMTEKLAMDSARRVLAYKAHDCLAETVLASFPVKPLQRKGVRQAAAFQEAQAQLQAVIRRFPLCIPPYLAQAELLRYLDRPQQALTVLLSATQRFDTRVGDESNRLLLLKQASQLAAALDQPRRARFLALSLLKNQPDNAWARQFLADHGWGERELRAFSES